MTDIKDLTTPDTLVDINDISVNKDLPKIWMNQVIRCSASLPR